MFGDSKIIIPELTPKKSVVTFGLFKKFVESGMPLILPVCHEEIHDETIGIISDSTFYALSDHILKSNSKKEPYVESVTFTLDKSYNPDYGDNRICKCGHPYFRHFDSWDDNEACECKYCSCFTFEEKIEE